MEEIFDNSFDQHPICKNCKHCEKYKSEPGWLIKGAENCKDYELKCKKE